MKVAEHFLRNAIFYELYVDKFAGNFRALTERLPYLAELGVTHVHLLPHYPSPMIDGGYDVSDYLGVRLELGTLDDFDRFAAHATELGISIMLDLVFNPTSSRHPWFEESFQNPQSPKRNYYLWSSNGTELADSTVCFPEIKAKNWIFHENRKEYHFSTFCPEQADLNWDNPAVFEEFCRIMDFWVARGVRLFRLDAASHIIKREGTPSRNLPETHAVLRKIRAYVDAHYPEVKLVAEVHDPIERMREYFGNGDECHLVYHFPLAEALIAEMALGEKGIEEQYIWELSDTPRGSSWLLFLRNHDDISLVTLASDHRRRFLRVVDPESHVRFGDGVALRLATVCERSLAHDTSDTQQREHGERECFQNILEELFSLPAPIVLYYGDELGMKNMPLAAGVRDIRVCVRNTFDWNEAERQKNDPDSTLSFIKKIAAARKKRME